jgi:hypothetical protein
LHDYYVKKAEDFAKKSDEHNNKNLLK